MDSLAFDLSLVGLFAKSLSCLPWPQSSWSVLVSVLVSVIEILNSASVGGQNFQLLLYILVMFCTLYILWPSLSTAFMAFGL